MPQKCLNGNDLSLTSSTRAMLKFNKEELMPKNSEAEINLNVLTDNFYLYVVNFSNEINLYNFTNPKSKLCRYVERKPRIIFSQLFLCLSPFDGF